MLATFSCYGDWFLPGSSEKLKGTLEYDPVEGSILEVFGSFELVEWDPRTVAIILGDTDKGHVTLLNCYFSYSNRTGKVMKTGYSPAMILAGELFEKAEDIQFTDVYFEAFNFFEWINKRSLQSVAEDNTQDNFSITYSRPSPIPFNLHEHCKGKINFGSTSSHIDVPHKITTTETCTVHLQFDQHVSYQDILTDVTIFYQFISLCTFEQSYPTSVFFTSPDITGRFKHEAINKEWKKHIHCHFSNTYYKPEFKVRRTYEHILRYEDIQDGFANIIAAWYKYYKQIEPTFILLLRFFQDKLTANTEKFMDQARAIETFHRRTGNINRMTEDDYQEVLERILDNPLLSEDEKDWLKSKIGHGYEPTLRKRLKDLLDKYSNTTIETFIPSQNEFIEAVIKNRNAYTHFGQEGGWQPLHALALQELSDKIMLVLICAIFTELGITHEQYSQGINRQFMRRIRLKTKQ